MWAPLRVHIGPQLQFDCMGGIPAFGWSSNVGIGVMSDAPESNELAKAEGCTRGGATLLPNATSPRRCG
eukprot:3949012-Prorocentrum_lima.AAC.1